MASEYFRTPAVTQNGTSLQSRAGSEDGSFRKTTRRIYSQSSFIILTFTEPTVAHRPRCVVRASRVDQAGPRPLREDVRWTNDSWACLRAKKQPIFFTGRSMITKDHMLHGNVHQCSTGVSEQIVKDLRIILIIIK